MASLARTLRLTTRLLATTKMNTHERGYASEMAFTFAAANQVYYANANVKQVDVPSFSGSFGILPDHVPTLAVLRPGVVTVFEQDGSSKKVFVSSGTVTINDDSSVQILAEEAHPVENLDATAARDVLSKAQSELSSATTDVAKAEAQIAVEVAEALVAAAQ
uniref:ATP synthase F(1) complex subunit delta, mitochondrial n=1 Tax=Clastoptera arizonana TaxID=38151 RepID=A0A1B6C446_9HEMI